MVRTDPIPSQYTKKLHIYFACTLNFLFKNDRSDENFEAVYLCRDNLSLFIPRLKGPCDMHPNIILQTRKERTASMMRCGQQIGGGRCR